MDVILQNTYIIESVLASGILYFIYLIALRNRPMLVFNRILLLLMPFIGILVPLFNFSIPQNSGLPTSSVLLEGVTVNLDDGQTTSINILNWKTIYFLVAVIFLIHFILQLIHIIRLGKKTNGKSYNLISGKYPHFSFFTKIFINGEIIQSKKEMETVLEHERVHVKQFHSFDILLFEILKMIFWFNPFIWLIKNLAVENHEYLADKGMLKSTSKNTYDYFNELFQSTLFTYKISIVNNFNHSLLKKRIKMMTKQNLKTIERFIPLMIIPIFILVVIFFACTDNISAKEDIENDVTEIKNQQEQEVTTVDAGQKQDGKQEKRKYIEDSEKEFDEKLYFTAEVMPKFNGGEFNNFRKYVQKNLKYPKEASDKRLSGTVYVQFVVGVDGEIKNVEVIRSISPELDAEAKRVVESSPDWTPAKEDGENVPLQFTMPIKFMLQDGSWDVEDSRKEKAETQKQNLPDPSSGIILVTY